MKTVIILLCVVLIGFGYLLSDNIKTQDKITQLQQQISQLEQEKGALQTQLNRTLAQLAQTEQAKHELTQENAAEAETIRQLNLTIADQKRQLAALQTRVVISQALAPLQKSLAGVLQAGILLPIIPAVIATTYVIVRSGNHAPRKSKNTTNSVGTWVQLTDCEVKHLIQLRRKQYR